MDRNTKLGYSCAIAKVALRKESVDRNRRWVFTAILPRGVALRKESVDRNIEEVAEKPKRVRRSPQGERG